MAHVLAQVRLERSNELPVDVIVNTFHFGTSGLVPTPGEQTSILDRLVAFYTQTQTGGSGGVQTILSSLLSSTLNAHSIRLYNQTTPIPRVPLEIRRFSLTPGVSLPLPAEVALVLSFKGPTAGRPIGRTRGRIYLGTINVQASSGPIAADSRPTSTAIDILVAAGAKLGTVLDTLTEPVWCVFSEADQALYPVSSVSCDNAWDTQRSRGAVATSRTTEPVVLPS